MSFTLTSSAAIIQKAGANADSTAIASGALMLNFADQAEGIVCSKTRVDWITQYSALNANFKKIIDSAVSSKAAMFILNYDLSGFTSRFEAQTMLDVLRDDFADNIKELKEAEVRRAMGVT